LLEVGCFDPVFRKAGDDVDLCWRLQQAGFRLGFSPAGFVWHARRSTVRAYLRQQAGYGEAEALLARKHPEYFNPLGGGMWRGRIYGAGPAALRTRRPVIYHGRFGRGMFQSMYAAPPSHALMLATSLEYHVLVTLPLFVLGGTLAWLLPLALASLLVSLAVCAVAGAQAEIPAGKRRLWSRPLVGLLFGLQPIARGWARYRGRLLFAQTPLHSRESLESVSRKHAGHAPVELCYPAPADGGREAFLQAVFARLERDGWQHRGDSGWNEFDAEAYGSRWSKLQLSTVDEVSESGRTWVRCRLRSRWTLPARLAFWGVTGAALLGAGVLRRYHEVAWLLLLAPVALAWAFTADQRNLRRVFAVWLDDMAEKAGWSKAITDGAQASDR
jgi:hypothetical protein